MESVCKSWSIYLFVAVVIFSLDCGMLPNSGGKNGKSKPREAYALIPKFSTRIEERRNPNSNKYNAMRTHWSTDHTKINMDWSLHYSNKSNQILHSTRTEACNSGEQQQNTLSTCLRRMFDSIKRLTDTHTHTHTLATTKLGVSADRCNRAVVVVAVFSFSTLLSSFFLCASFFISAQIQNLSLLQWKKER